MQAQNFTCEILVDCDILLCLTDKLLLNAASELDTDKLRKCTASASAWSLPHVSVPSQDGFGFQDAKSHFIYVLHVHRSWDWPVG